MNKLVFAIVLCVVMGACKKREAAEDSATSAAADTAVVATEAEAKAATEDAPAVAGAEGLPKECEEYLNRAKACFAKSSGNGFAAQFQKSVDQAKEQWEQTADKSGLGGRAAI